MPIVRLSSPKPSSRPLRARVYIPPCAQDALLHTDHNSPAACTVLAPLPKMTSSSEPAVNIIDIHAREAPLSDRSIRNEIITGLSCPVGQKWLPTMLLYNEHGLRIYDRITTDAPEYYLFPAEEEILKNNADNIVKVMHAAVSDGGLVEEVVVELGAG